MSALLVLALVLVVWFVLAGLAKHAQKRLDQHGIHALTWRWFSGQAHHGKPVTTRGWGRHGAPKALTPSGYAHRRWYQPRELHALWRIQWTLVTVLTCASLLFRFRPAVSYLGITALAGAVYGSRRGMIWTRDYQHRKNYVKPAHVRLAAAAGIPLAARPESWIEVPKDREYAQFTWPRGAELPKPQDRDHIADVAISTLGMKGARPSWQFTGPRLRLKLMMPFPPPDWVYLDRIEWGPRIPPGVAQEAVREAIRAAGVDDLVLGIGFDGKVITVSLKTDSPHIVLSVDTGGGKSVLVRCLASQVLMRGGIAAILDNKLVSHPSLRGLPNVAYCDDIEKIHDFLVWLDGELIRRGQYVRDHTDFLGVLHGTPGRRLVVFLEEQNLLMNRLRAFWDMRLAENRKLPKDEREELPAVSPAIRGFENASYVGRELNVHLVFVSQRFTAEAAGGGAKGAAVRMNTGIRLLGGYDDATVDMLIGKKTQVPPPSKHAGRMLLHVKGGDLAEVQIVFFTHAETRQFAETSDVRVPAALRHLTVFRPAGVADPRPAGDPSPGRGGDGAAMPAGPARALPPAVRNWVTIKQAREAGWIPHTWKNPSGAFGTLKNRAKKEGRTVPAVKGMKGTAAMYDAVELADFLERETASRAL